MSNSIFELWLSRRKGSIIIFVTLFFFLDIITTAIGLRLGAIEANPIAAPIFEAGNWPLLFFIKLTATLIILGIMYMVFYINEKAKQKVAGILEERWHELTIINLKEHDLEIYGWGLVVGSSLMVVVVNLLGIFILLGLRGF